MLGYATSLHTISGLGLRIRPKQLVSRIRLNCLIVVGPHVVRGLIQLKLVQVKAGGNTRKRPTKVARLAVFLFSVSVQSGIEYQTEDDNSKETSTVARLATVICTSVSFAISAASKPEGMLNPFHLYLACKHRYKKLHRPSTGRVHGAGPNHNVSCSLIRGGVFGRLAPPFLHRQFAMIMTAETLLHSE